MIFEKLLDFKMRQKLQEPILKRLDKIDNSLKVVISCLDKEELETSIFTKDCRID